MSEVQNLVIHTNGGMIHTLVAYGASSYPRGFGNAVQVEDSVNKRYFNLVNMSFEDLRDAKARGDVDDTLAVMAYPVDEYGWVAYVTDVRLPMKARSSHHWYRASDEATVALARARYEVDESICVCEHEDSKYLALRRNNSFTDDGGITYYKCKCPQCGKQCELLHERHLEMDPTAVIVRRESKRDDIFICVTTNLPDAYHCTEIYRGIEVIYRDYYDGLVGTGQDLIDDGQRLLNQWYDKPIEEVQAICEKYMAGEPVSVRPTTISGRYFTTISKDEVFRA